MNRECQKSKYMTLQPTNCYEQQKRNLPVQFHLARMYRHTLGRKNHFWDQPGAMADVIRKSKRPDFIKSGRF
jgi:hypothetical protein